MWIVLRLVTDRDTGKPKGFAFCEYFDVATAAAAQRNLNNHEMGGRHIHVDFAEDKDNKDRPRRDGMHLAASEKQFLGLSLL